MANLKSISIQQILDAVPNSDYSGSQLNTVIQQVEFDSRKITNEALFVPLTSGRTDGHDYIQTAIEQGAIATFWQKDKGDPPNSTIHTIIVEDTLVAFQQLAAYYRQLIDPIVIGITGSNGKTTTKDMTTNVLKTKYHVHHTQGNYNNEIGVPYTILQMPENTEVLVCEMGMSGYGEIELLSHIANPNIAVITLIGESHLEYLGSRRGIAQAKLEILKGSKEDVTLLCPAEEPLIDEMLTQEHSLGKIIRIGLTDKADIYAYDMIEEPDSTYFRTNLNADVYCMIPVMGAYNVTNALFALSIAEELDVPLEQAIFQLAHFELTANRLQWLETKQGARLLNDAYNASPTSMQSVLKTFSELSIQSTQRKFVLLGDILELGEQSSQMHSALADWLDPRQIDGVFLFGHQMKVLYERLKEKFPEDQLFYEVENHEKVILELSETLTPDDYLLVKASYGTDLLSVVSELTGVKTKG